MKEFVEKLIEMLEETRGELIVWNHHKVNVYGNAIRIVNQLVEEYNSELIEKINFAIEASNTNDNYMTGLRNGMRYCLALIDGKEPEFENCNQDLTKSNQGWIPVTEKLPEEGKAVLTCAKNGWISVNINTPYNGKKNDFECGYYIAWMPLPEPYKPKENTPSKSSSFEEKPNFYSERFNKVN